MDDTTEQKKELDEPESTDTIADEVKEENSSKTSAKTSSDVPPDAVDSDCSKSKDDNKEIENGTDEITNAEDEKPVEKQQNENDDKNTENKMPTDNSLTNAEEKANSETEETDELQLIYKGLTDPSLSSKKIPDKLVESTSSAVTTKNLIEFLEDESDIQVENSSTLKSDDSFLNIRAAEKTTAVSDQPMEVEQEKTSADDKIVTAPTTTVRRIPSLVLTRLDDEIEQFADKPFYEKIKTALKLLKGEKMIAKEPPAIVSKASTDCDTAIKKEEVNNNSNNDVEFLEKIDVVKVEPVEEENVDFERIAKTNNESLLDNKENEAVPPVENVPKRRGRKKGVHYSRTPITHDKGYDEDYKMSREPVKFSMQTRKRKLKFLPDGSLVSHKYSPPSSRVDSGDSSGSEDSDAEFNESSVNEEPPAKRKYVRKSSTIQSSTPVLGIKRGPGRPPKNRSFDFETYCKNRMSGKPLPYEVEKPLDECLKEDDVSAIKKRYSGAIDPASIMTYLINERITLSRMNSHKFPLVVDKDKRDMQLYKQFTTCSRSSVVRLTTNDNTDGNDSKLQRGHITTSNKSASISYEIMKTRDKLKAINFDHSRQFGDIIIPKNLDQPVKYGVQIPNGTVIRKSAPGKFGSIVPIEKPKIQSPLPNNSNDNNNNNKSTLSSEDNSDNKTNSTKKSGLGQLFRDMAKDADTDENSSSSKKPNDSLAVNNNDQHANKDSDEKETEDENLSKMDCENSSETNFWSLKKDNQQSSTSSVSLPICLNREDIRKKESRTVKTTRGPKKALKQPANDEDDDTYIYNISDADDTMLKLVTEHLQMSAKSRSIYDLMEEITLQMPTWNLHIMPDKSSFCIAQVARGRMGIPILKKSIELDTNFSAKVYVHQLHCKRYDGTYNDEHSLVNLIREIDSLSA